MPILNANPGDNSKRILQWVDWADKDYISARMVLLESLIVPGATLSNTAIEKYFKAVCLVAQLQIPKTHNLPKLDELIRSKGINLKLNADYLRLLSKAYDLRYPDNLPTGYNICLTQTKLIAELDCSVFEIRKGFGFKSSSGNDVRTRLDFLLNAKDKTLMLSNCAFGPTKRDDVFAKRTKHYELRVLQGGIIMEAEYETEGIKDDGIFDVVALKPGKSG